MVKLKFFIRTTKTGKNEASIRLRLTNGRQFNTTASIQKQIYPAFWNNKAGIVRQLVEFPDAINFQSKLDALKSDVKNEFGLLIDKSKLNNAWLVSAIEKHYNPNKYLQEKTTLFGYIQNFIDNSDKRINAKTGNPVCYKMRREYEVTFDYLKLYAKEYGEPDFVDIDLEFYQQFVDMLRNKRIEIIKKEKKVTKKGLSTNTIGKKVQTLKIFLNTATEEGINHFHKYKSRNFKTLTEESDNIYLTKAELDQFYEFNFSDKQYLERVRDKFIVGCWTGVRYDDLQQITPDKIKGEFIELKQKKTGKKVVIPVHKVVQEILNKYDGNLPEPISNQKYNEYLKEAAKLAELNGVFIKTASKKGMSHEKKYLKHELISSHTARRSFCTNAYKDNIPTLAIMAISGHKTEQAFLKYIKADGKDHAEKVLEIWRQNAEHLSVVK